MMERWWKKKEVVTTLLNPRIVGEGSFGRVYGPYDAVETELFLSRVWRQDVIHEVRGRKKYIIKIIYRHGIRERKRIVEIGRMFDKFQKHGTVRWIASLNVGIIHRKELVEVLGKDAVTRKQGYLYEIQEYGGHNMLDVMKDKDIPWTAPMMLIIWKSIREILRIGIRMIESGYLMSDIKMDNMVIDFSRGIYVIDPEIYLQKNLFFNEFPTVTPDPLNLPVQFINPVFFSKREMKEMMDLYKERWTGFHEDVNECPLKELMIKTTTVPRKKKEGLEFIQYMASLSLFYPFMMIMIMLLKKLPLSLVTSEKILTNINLFCRWVIKDRARIPPTVLLKIMDMVSTPHLEDVLKTITKRQDTVLLYKSSSPLLLKEKNRLTEHTVIQDYYMSRNDG